MEATPGTATPGTAGADPGCQGAVPAVRDLTAAAWSVVTTALGVGTGIAVVDGVSVEGPAPVVAASVVVFAADAVAQPLLRRMASFGSVLLALGLGVLGQVAVVVLALQVVPGIASVSWAATVTVLAVAVVVMALGRWVAGSADSAYVLGTTVRRARRAARRARRSGHLPARRGLLVVQLDGVSPTVLRRAFRAGQAPNLGRLVAHGSHRTVTWRVGLPSTTPASQAGFLHRDEEQAAAFRWWDREAGRLVVTNRPSDAALVEGRMRPGSGLLRDGGVAVSTMFSGEADTALLVMSRSARRGGLGPGGSYLSFFASPLLLPRALTLTVAEMVKELYQGRRQRVRGVHPRVNRRGAYVALRGITNVLLRGLNLTLVGESMAAGAPVIYVNLVDYDEIAHHAGPERPESLRALEGVDGVVGQLERLATAFGTRYDLVVLSDHGQSLGATFAQVAGGSLAEVVRTLTADDLNTLDASTGEEWGPLNTLITSVASGSTSRPERLVLGPDRRVAGDDESSPDLAVVGSGNLGMVWFPRLRRRPDLAAIHQRWPRLVTGLALTQGIGLVMVAGLDGNPVVFGPRGVRHLGTGTVGGDDPLAGYPPPSAADLLRLHSLPTCGDVVVVSSLGPGGEVHAFEELVGSHGGLGGSQNEGLLVFPASWDLDTDLLTVDAGQRRLIGAGAVGEQLARWRRRVETEQPETSGEPGEARRTDHVG